ncbi:MAG TPA: DUF2971 domain-containing protein [Panacibacter sp.]|nr:DUF2971 domain-containing protein [Panacibacter sp.]
MKKIIYKYFRVNSFLYDTLLSNQLYFSSFHQFNDPYDSYMTFFDKVTNDDFKIYLDHFHATQEIKDKYLKVFNSKPEEFIKPFIDAYKGWIDYHGICCFTKSKNNILLWSHYADSHKGVCLGFDYDLIIKKFPQFDEVEYSDKPFYFDFRNPADSIAKTILRKSTEWKYEEEIRFIMERSRCVNFPQDALLEINFGTRCNKREMMNIQHVISKLNYPNCTFKSSIINSKEYSVEFEDCNIDELRKTILMESIEIRYKHTLDLKGLLDDNA